MRFKIVKVKSTEEHEPDWFSIQDELGLCHGQLFGNPDDVENRVIANEIQKQFNK